MASGARHKHPGGGGGNRTGLMCVHIGLALVAGCAVLAFGAIGGADAAGGRRSLATSAPNTGAGVAGRDLLPTSLYKRTSPTSAGASGPVRLADRPNKPTNKAGRAQQRGRAPTAHADTVVTVESSLQLPAEASDDADGTQANDMPRVLPGGGRGLLSDDVPMALPDTSSDTPSDVPSATATDNTDTQVQGALTANDTEAAASGGNVTAAAATPETTSAAPEANNTTTNTTVEQQDVAVVPTPITQDTASQGQQQAVGTTDSQLAVGGGHTDATNSSALAPVFDSGLRLAADNNGTGTLDVSTNNTQLDVSTNTEPVNLTLLVDATKPRRGSASAAAAAAAVVASNDNNKINTATSACAPGGAPKGKGKRNGTIPKIPIINNGTLFSYPCGGTAVVTNATMRFPNPSGGRGGSSANTTIVLGNTIVFIQGRLSALEPLTGRGTSADNANNSTLVLKIRIALNNTMLLNNPTIRFPNPSGGRGGSSDDITIALHTMVVFDNARRVPQPGGGGSSSLKPVVATTSVSSSALNQRTTPSSKAAKPVRLTVRSSKGDATTTAAAAGQHTNLSHDDLSHDDNE